MDKEKRGVHFEPHKEGGNRVIITPENEMFFLIVILQFIYGFIFAAGSGVNIHSLDDIDKILLSRNFSQQEKHRYFQDLLPLVQNISSSQILNLPINLPALKKGHPGTYVPYNPSMVKTPDGYDLICRTANFLPPAGQTIIQKDRRNHRNYFLHYDKEFKLITQGELFLPAHLAHNVLKTHWLEDCRLFQWRDSYWVNAFVRIFSKKMIQKVALCKLSMNGKKDKSVEKMKIFYGPNHARWEKNWLTVVENDALKFIYSYDPFIVYSPNVETGRCETILHYTPLLDFSHFRGSASPILFEDGYLMLIHEVVVRNRVHRIYIHRFLFLDKDLHIKKISKPFTFKHRGIEFCTSMVIDHTGGYLVMPIGIEDREAKICIVELKQVKEMLVDVTNYL